MTPADAAGDLPPHAGDARVVLYTRAGCHLCEQARAVVSATCADLGVDWAEIDIDAPEHPQLRERFTEEVPVTFVDGRQHDFWRVDPGRLRSALTGN
jgi:glutaredoxin